jgi:hypothetical protein
VRIRCFVDDCSYEIPYNKELSNIGWVYSWYWDWYSLGIKLVSSPY